MRVAVIGSREGFTKAFVWEHLVSLDKDDVIISGGARGVDTFAQEFAEWRPMGFELYRPRRVDVKGDYINRNILIVNESDRIIAFWNGISKGTKFVIDYATKKGKLVEVVRND